MAHYAFATRINPHNGQEIEDFPNGIDLDGPRFWSDFDKARYPQADRQVGEGFRLVEDTHCNVYAVPD